MDEKTKECRTDCKGYHAEFIGNSLNVADKCKYSDEINGFSLWYIHDIKPEDCKDCPHYKCKYIQYPITVNKIEMDDMKPDTDLFHETGDLVAIRPSNDTKTYLGLFLGHLPLFTNAHYDETNASLSIKNIANPAILVPALKKIVFGAESWWTPIKDQEDIKQITDDDINGQWYVQLAKLIGDAKTQKAGETPDPHQTEEVET